MPEEFIIVFWIIQINAALEYLKENKIVHRDIKLDNILLDERCNALLGDFGLSKVLVDGKEYI